MEKTLNNQLSELNKRSTNKKILTNYQKKIDDIINKINIEL